MKIQELLQMVVERNASDLHLTVGLPPMLRIQGQLVPIDMERLGPQEVEDLIYNMFTDEQKEKFIRERGIDFTYSFIGRFKVNAYIEKGYVAAVLRLIPFEIPSIEKLKLPPGVADLARRQGGLVLVTGPHGYGKSTTLAAMIALINSERSCHIITIEDPIEYLHEHKKSIINQREVFSDVNSFVDGMINALREDPDVIMVGEMRDLETIAIATTAAEAGYLVLASLNTPDAVHTIDRLVGVFPVGQQRQIRLQVALSLQGIISQRLLPQADGKGRVAAVELLVGTPAISNLIREEKTQQIYSNIETGSTAGMQSFNQSLCELYWKNLIKIHDALAYSNNPEVLRHMLLRK